MLFVMPICCESYESLWRQRTLLMNHDIFQQDKASAHKSLISMDAMLESLNWCSPYLLYWVFPIWLSSVAQQEKKFGWGTVSQRFWFFYLLMTFWSKGGMLHHQSDQRSPTPMEEFCKPYGEIMLKNKCHLFTFREIVFVSLCTLQPTNVAWKFVLSLNKYWKQMLYRDTWIWFKKKKKVKVRKRSNICESIKPEISQRIFL